MAAATIAGEVGDVADGRQRVHAAEEADLGLVDVADAGEVALLEQRVADRGVRVGPQVRQGHVGVPVGAEQVGSEVADQVVLLGRCGTRSSSTWKPTASVVAVRRTTRAVWAGAPPGAAGCTCQVPSIFRWVCRVRPLSKRVSRCLPRETVSMTVAPERSLVASDGIRKSLRVSTWPDRPRSSSRRPEDGVALGHVSPAAAVRAGWR